MTRIGLALAATLAALAVAAPTAGATFPGKPGEIVFFSLDRQDDRLLYRISPSGGKVRTTPFDGHNAAYSADGKYVAYLSDDGFRVANADGSNPRPVPGGGEPAWSPDGREIATTFTNSEDYPYIEITDVATGVMRHLINGEDPSWSPDGKTIVYNTANHGALCKIRPDGTGQSCFKAASKMGASDPDWSPGGKAIVVAVGSRIAVLRSNGSFARWISPPIKPTRPISTRVFNPSWSPDGKRVVYERGKGYRRGSLYVTSDRGGRQRYLTGGINPIWSPRR